MVKQVQIMSNTRFLINRPSTKEEEKKFGSKRVIDSVSLDDVKDLDPGQNYQFIAGIPKDVPVKDGPVKNIDELTSDTEIKDELELALFNEMIRVISDGYRIQYKTKDNKEKMACLLPAVQNAFKDYLSKYASIQKKDDVLYLDTRNMYWIIFALADIISREKVGGEKLSSLFVKQQQEGELRWVDLDRNERVRAQMLAYREMSKYNPTKPGWDLPKFRSFRKFHQAISDLIKDSIEKYKGREQPTLILEMAYEILESKRKEKHWPKKSYTPKEIPWYARN